MHESSLIYLRCVNCNSELDLKIFDKSNEIEEGIMLCTHCNTKYPIILKIPILWTNLTSYFSNRMRLGGYLMNKTKNYELKNMIKESLSKIDNPLEDVTELEKRWACIYRNSLKSKFYHHVKKSLEKLPKCKLVLEHGCSIGKIAEIMSKKHTTVFGIDQSFSAIIEAKKNHINNIDYFVANSLYSPFGNRKFDLVVGLNVLELVEPLDFLKVVTTQLEGILILTDPYDFERGKNSTRIKMDENMIRQELKNRGFIFLQKTGKPSYLPWKLNINNRLSLSYRVDLVIAKNSLTNFFES